MLILRLPTQYRLLMPELVVNDSMMTSPFRGEARNVDGRGAFLELQPANWFNQRRNEDSGHRLRRTRTCAGMETGAIAARHADVVRAGQRWYRAGTAGQERQQR